MNNNREMFTFNSYLYINKQRASETASLYLMVIIDRDKKPFPLKLKWPTDKIDLDKGILLPRHKKDNEVSDYNLIISCAKQSHTEIQLTYRLRKETLTMVKFYKELRTFNTRESFTSYIELERNRRYNRKDIEMITWRNHHACKIALMRYDPICKFENINTKWLTGFKSFLQHYEWDKGRYYKPATIWKFLCTTKAYLTLASEEPMIYVDEKVLKFRNPKVEEQTTYLNTEELRRLIILMDGSVIGTERNVLQAFIFQCFTSLRISDVYLANAKWEEQDGFMDFIPHKNRKSGKKIRVPLLPMAMKFINSSGFYFSLPSSVKYNEMLKFLAQKALINKTLTSHVGRHTFGFLYMQKAGNIYGLQQILGHKKLETTLRYAHINDEYKRDTAMQIQEEFKDLLGKVVKLNDPKTENG